MIGIKLFTDKRVWCRKYDNEVFKKYVHIWDKNGNFLDKKKLRYVNSHNNLQEINAQLAEKKRESDKNRRTDRTSEGEEGLPRLSDVYPSAPTVIDVDCNRHTEERLYVIVAVPTISDRQNDDSGRCSKNNAILRTKRNKNGHIVFRTYECSISILLQNIVERLNDENFNTYENDDNEGSVAKSYYNNDRSEWQTLTNEIRVTEDFIRNNFYMLLTQKRSVSVPTLAQKKTKAPIANMADLNILIDLSDSNRCCFDVRDDQEIHIRPTELYVPIDIVFAGENGICGLYSTKNVLSSNENAPPMDIKIQRVDHRCVLYVKFNAINKKSDGLEIERMLSAIRQVCDGLALKNWYDYDFCLGRKNEEEANDTHCVCAFADGNYSSSRWYCGIRESLAQLVKKNLSDLREWVWIDPAIAFGKIDFFYWNFLFLRKRLCLYENPLNGVKSNAKHFVGSHPLHETRGNMLDLCFDCWNFTSNLGEMVCILSRSRKTLDKKKVAKYDTQCVLRTINSIVNNKVEQQFKKKDQIAINEYVCHVIERVLLRVNEAFFAANSQKSGTRICLDTVFGDGDKKEAKSATSVTLRTASECWRILRLSIRIIEGIRARESMQLVRCAEQLMRSSKLLFYSGLSNFSVTCILSINQHNHLCITLDNSKRLVASPLEQTYENLDDNVSSRLYLKSTKDRKQSDPSIKLFISALDETVQKRKCDKPVVEKYMKQRIFVKTSIKKKRLPTLFSTKQVEYIAVDTDKKSAIVNGPRDRCVKYIHIEEDNDSVQGMKLTLNDPHGRCDEKSQIALLLDDIKVAHLRKKLINATLATMKFNFLQEKSTEQKKKPEDWYAVPTSKKTIFDDKKNSLDRQNESTAEVLDGKTLIPEKTPSVGKVSKIIDHITGISNDDVRDIGIEIGVENGKIGNKRCLTAYFTNLYATLTEIMRLVDMEEKGIVLGKTNDSLRQRCRYNREKLNSAYAYLTKNHEKIICQQAIFATTVEVLDNVSKISMDLISQKQYNTNEKMRKLLLGMLAMTEKDG